MNYCDIVFISICVFMVDSDGIFFFFYIKLLLCFMSFKDKIIFEFIFVFCIVRFCV